MMRGYKGKERDEGAVEMEKGRTAWHGVSSILGVRAGRRRHVARSRDFGEEPGARGGEFGREGWRVAGCETATNGEATGKEEMVARAVL